MYVHRRRKRVEIWTPAKLNLYLEVLRRRSDGYHEIETLMVPIGLFDTLHLTERNDARIKLSVVSSSRVEFHRSMECGVGQLPAPDQNLAYRAVELLRQRAGVSRGLNLTLFKRIPIASGLGGASSDAAAALWGANLLWNLNQSRRDLADVAAELGSDVAFFLYGSPAICRGRGEQVERVPHFPHLHFVVMRPPEGLSTSEVYSQMKLECQPPGRLEGRVSADVWRNGANGAANLFNRLQTTAKRIAPWMQGVQQLFDDVDLLGHQMSGSGSAYFGVCRDARHARRVAAILQNRCKGSVFHAASVAGRQPCIFPASQN